MHATTLALVGATGGAGTTRTAVELAALGARDGRDVAVVDAAFTTQGLSEYVSGRIGTDLTTLVTDETGASLSAGTYPIALGDGGTGGDSSGGNAPDLPGRADVIPARAPFERVARAKTAEAARKLERRIDEAATSYDAVIVDAAPVGSNEAVAGSRPPTGRRRYSRQRHTGATPSSDSAAGSPTWAVDWTGRSRWRGTPTGTRPRTTRTSASLRPIPRSRAHRRRRQEAGRTRAPSRRRSRTPSTRRSGSSSRSPDWSIGCGPEQKRAKAPRRSAEPVGRPERTAERVGVVSSGAGGTGAERSGASDVGVDRLGDRGQRVVGLDVRRQCEVHLVAASECDRLAARESTVKPVADHITAARRERADPSTPQRWSAFAPVIGVTPASRAASPTLRPAV